VTTKTRREELLALLEAFDETDRAMLTAALVAQGQGRLAASARVVADRVSKGGAAVSWAALLMALEAAELELGGAVKVATPSSGRDRWGFFSAQVWPSATLVSLRLDHPEDGAWSLVADPVSSVTLPAIGAIARALATHFGRTVVVVNARNGKPA
jgi:hypothetical protein